MKYKRRLEDQMKNEILAEAIEIANRSTMKLPTYAHLDTLYAAWQRSEKLLWVYRRQTETGAEACILPSCIGLVSICPCTICESIRADDRQDRIDENNEDFRPELARRKGK